MTDVEIKQRVAFKAVIVNDKNEVLVLREANTYEEGTQIGRYGLPGGRLQPGEAWEDGLKREVHEETGLEVERPYGRCAWASGGQLSRAYHIKS